MRNLRYKVSWKRKWLDQLLSWREALIPYCQVRYAF
jgi:spore photoproduct lyase